MIIWGGMARKQSVWLRRCCEMKCRKELHTHKLQGLRQSCAVSVILTTRYPLPDQPKLKALLDRNGAELPNSIAQPRLG